MSKGIGGHQRPHRGHSDDWLTPPDILAALGNFDLDPCACALNKWWTKTTLIYTRRGLDEPWCGRVFLNPPYGPETGKWLQKLATHGNGIALIFARTETATFFRQVWDRADAVLFLKGRLHFYKPTGERAPGDAGGPSCLVAYGAQNSICLEECHVKGKFVRLKEFS